VESAGNIIAIIGLGLTFILSLFTAVWYLATKISRLATQTETLLDDTAARWSIHDSNQSLYALSVQNGFDEAKIGRRELWREHRITSYRLTVLETQHCMNHGGTLPLVPDEKEG